MPLFMQGRVPLEPEPERYSSSPVVPFRRHHNRWRILPFGLCSAIPAVTVVLVAWNVLKVLPLREKSCQ